MSRHATAHKPSTSELEFEAAQTLAHQEATTLTHEVEVLGRARDWSLDFASLIGLPSSFLAVLASTSVVHAALTTLFITSVAAVFGRVLPRILTERLRQTPIALVAVASGLMMALVTAIPTLLRVHPNLDATGVAAVASLTITTIFTASYIASRALKIQLGPLRFAMPLVFLLGATAGCSLVLLLIRVQQLLQ